MPLHRRTAASRASQRGITLIGLLSWAVVVGFAGYLAVRIVPAVIEFYAIQRAVDKLAAEPAPTVAGIRAAFDRQRDIDNAITAIRGGDLDITKENERVVIRYDYEREIELISPVFLLIKFAGVSK